MDPSHHASRPDRPRRRDTPLWAWDAPIGGRLDAAAMTDLLSRAATYDRAGDPFGPAGMVACAEGLEGILTGGGSCRALFAVPILGPKGSWSSDEHGAATEAFLRERIDAALADPEARAALDLMAYLFARGRLAIRFALPVPEKPDLASYGHPHAVWGLVRDAGHAVLVVPRTGGLAVLGRDASPAVELAASSTERLWTDDRVKPQVETLPPSVATLLVRRGERVLRPARTPVPGTPTRAFSPAEVLRFALLRDAPRMPGGRRIGIESAPVAPWPHQVAVARRIVEGYPRSWLLADEVGLGKTIEAGLALRALVLSGTCSRALVAAPASLCGQWQREMRAKFALDFSVAEPGARERLYEPDLLVVSRSLLASAETGRAAALAAAAPWDIAVADEAHGARRGTNLADAIENAVRPRSASLLLATATPMQMQARDAFDLNRWTRRGGAFDGDDVLSEAYYRALEELPEKAASPARPGSAQRAFIARTLREQRDLDPAEWARAWSNATFVASEATRRDVLAFVDGEVDEVQPHSFKALRHLAYAVAPLGRTMLRHGRAILRLYESRGLGCGMRLPQRVVRARAMAFDAREDAFNGLLEAYVTGLSRRLSAANRKAARGASFYASFVRLRAASSETAALRTFRRRLAKVETCLASAAVREHAKAALADLGEAVLGIDDDCPRADEAVLKDRTVPDLVWEAERLRELLVALDGRGDAPTSKAAALLDALADARGRGAVVFTRFRDTLDEIVAMVEARAPHLRFGTYSGLGGAVYDRRERRLVPRDREEVTAAMQAGLLDLLVCTDAAAEGLNLQRAGLLVNYDLPWNPTKVEQRIGRLDRIGQVHDEVEVVNLIYQGSAEERVYARLLARLDAIGSIVGSQQIALIPLSEGDFLTLASAGVSERDKAALVERAQRSALDAARRIQSREIPARHLLATYWNEEARVQALRMPARLGDLWRALATSPTLAAYGFAPREDGNLAVPDGLLGHRPHMLTIDRDLHAVGMAPDGVRTAFATWGDPGVEGIFRLFAERPLPAFARRLEVRVRVADRDVPVVGYAVATATGPALYTAVDDIEACPHDPTRAITEDDAKALLPRLRALAEAEYADANLVAASERLSALASADRRRVVRGVCLALLDQRSGNGSFEAEMSTIEDKIAAMRDGPVSFVARVDPIAASLSPAIFAPITDGRPGRYRVSTDALTLRSAVSLAREVRDALRKGDAAEMRDVFLRILVDAREGIPGPDPREAYPYEPKTVPTAPAPRPAAVVPAPRTPIAPPPEPAVPVAPKPEPRAIPVPEIVPEPVAEPAACPFPPSARAEFLSAAAGILLFALSDGDARGYLAIAHRDLPSASAAVAETFAADESLGAALAASGVRGARTVAYGPDGPLGTAPPTRPCALVLDCAAGPFQSPSEAADLFRALLARPAATVAPASVRPPPVGAAAVPLPPHGEVDARPTSIGITRGDGDVVRLEHAGQALVLDAADLPDLVRKLSGLIDKPAAPSARARVGRRQRLMANPPRIGIAPAADRQDKIVLARLYAVYPEAIQAGEIDAHAQSLGLPPGAGHAALARLDRKGWVRRAAGGWSLVPEFRRLG